MRSEKRQTPEKADPSHVKVCHVTTVHGAFDTRIFFKECVTLARAGYDVHLIACHDHDETIDGIHIHALPTPPSRWRRLLFWPFRALVKALRCHAALYHLHDPELAPWGIVLRGLTRAKVIQDFHEDTAGDMQTKFWIPWPVRWLAASAVQLINSLMLFGAGVVESDMIEGRYRQPKQSVRNLPLLDERTRARRTPADFTHRPTLIYVGKLSALYGAWDMLALAEGLLRRGTTFRLEIIGPSDQPGLPMRMRQWAETHGLGDCVHLAGSMRHGAAMGRIREATVGLCFLKPIPNFAFSLSTKVLEYMSYGLPVVVNDSPCTAGYVRRCNAGLVVDPANEDDMVNCVVRLLDDPEEMCRLGQNGQECVWGGLNWREESKRLLRFYQRILYGDLPPNGCCYHRRRGQKAPPA